MSHPCISCAHLGLVHTHIRKFNNWSYWLESVAICDRAHISVCIWPSKQAPLSISVACMTHDYWLWPFTLNVSFKHWDDIRPSSLALVWNEALTCYIAVTSYLRMISQQDETLHYVHGIPSHGEHFGHEVSVTLEEGDGPQLDIEQQSRHPGKRVQVFLSLVRCGSNQWLKTLGLDCHLEDMRNIQGHLTFLGYFTYTTWKFHITLSSHYRYCILANLSSFLLFLYL